MITDFTRLEAIRPALLQSVVLRRPIQRCRPAKTVLPGIGNVLSQM